jgi:hypothetical protein
LVNVENPKTNKEKKRNENKTVNHSNLSRGYGVQHSSLSSGSGDADGAARRPTAEGVEAIR